MRAAVDWMFRDRTTGQIVIGQWPNLALWVFIVARAVRAVVDRSGDVRTVASVVGTVAVLVWAIDEVVRGVNPWRRIMGTVVGVATVVGLVW